jgi:hypothetical protein
MTITQVISLTQTQNESGDKTERQSEMQATSSKTRPSPKVTGPLQDQFSQRQASTEASSAQLAKTLKSKLMEEREAT